MGPKQVHHLAISGGSLLSARSLARSELPPSRARLPQPAGGGSMGVVGKAQRHLGKSFYAKTGNQGTPRRQSPWISIDVFRPATICTNILPGPHESFTESGGWKLPQFAKKKRYSLWGPNPKETQQLGNQRSCQVDSRATKNLSASSVLCTSHSPPPPRKGQGWEFQWARLEVSRVAEGNICFNSLV